MKSHPPPHQFPNGQEDRAYWVEVMTRTARPVLEAMAAGELHRKIPMEGNDGKHDVPRELVHLLEAIGRTICGIAPWLEVDGLEGDEARCRRNSARWQSAVFLEARKHLARQPGWQLYYWRDRSKEADFLFHRAGRFRIADAKWSEHPSSPGKIGRVLAELPDETPAALVCRSFAAYPLCKNVQALPLDSIPQFLS